jgi:hypothetical protein
MKRFLSLLAIALVSVSLSSSARADDTEKDKTSDAAAAESTTPELHFPPPSTRWKVLATGVFLTGAAWGISFACAEGWPYVSPSLQPTVPTAAHPLIASGPPESSMLKIPVVGPWVALTKIGCGSDQSTCGPSTGARVAAYILDGIVQLGGLALITEAIVMKTEEPAAPKASAFALHYGSLEVKPVPLVSPTVSGMSLIGTF